MAVNCFYHIVIYQSSLTDHSGT